jgi:tetratricopeptide (TPR) repeat protein
MVASLLRKCVDRYEQLLDYESAAFYAERWSVEEASEEARTCLARLYFRRHKIKQAYLILQGATSDDARYLLALCCVRLGLLREAEQALLSDSFNMPGNVGEVPGGAAGLFLLGCIYRKQHRKETAIEYLKRSLAEDPFMWSAVIELSEMGADFDLAVHHGMTVDVAGDFFSEQKINRNAVPLAVPEESRRERPLSLETVPQLSGSSSRKSLPHTAHLGLSSLSMRLPLPSPGSASPMRINSVPDSGVSSEHHVPARLYFDTPGLTPISSTSGGPGSSSRSQLQVNRALEFGRSTGAQTNTFSVLNTHSSKEDAPYSEPLSTRVGRRVSFGPTARLSFSSVPGVLDDLDDLEDAYTNPLKVQRTADVEIEAPSVMNEYRSKLRSYASEARDSRPPRGRRSVDGRTDRDAAEIREDDIEGVAALLLIFAEALKQLHRNDAPACIGWLQCLPLKQYCTGHVHHLLGLAYFNMRCSYPTTDMS